MVTPTTELVLHVVQFATGTMTILLLMRIGYVLSANPIGEFTPELIYLRVRELRQAGYALLVVILIEVAQLLLPFLQRQGYFRPFVDLGLFLDVAQGILVLIAAVTTAFVVGRYTHRALDRRIRESMETLAYLEGQRRRRRSAERGEWERAPDDE